MMVVSVAISNSTREFDKEYDYFIPDSMTDKVSPGIRVIVPFGKADRPTEAYVFRVNDSTRVDGLKEIKKVIDETPVLNPGLISLAILMKKKYICTFSDAVKSMLPPGISTKSYKIIKLLKSDCSHTPNEQKIVNAILENGNECEYEELRDRIKISNFPKLIRQMNERSIISIYERYSSKVSEKKIKVAYIARSREEIIDEIEGNRIKKIQQIKVLEMLLENEYIACSDIIRFASVTSSVLNTLSKYGFINFKDIEVKRDPLKHMHFDRTLPLTPTNEQSKVLRAVKRYIDSRSFEEFLIHGVTGSGKTEVYLQLIQHSLEQGRSAIVLVPEISLTPQMVERFKQRFGDEVAVLHSRLSLGERYDQWRLIRDGKIKVVVGARSAVFAPFSKIGIIIIDEEHESTYKSEVTPKYHARDIARERCRYDNAVLILGSATPAIETYYRAKCGEICLLEMNERANSLSLPEVHIVDMRKELEDGNKTIFSKRLYEEMEKNKKEGQQTMLFLNRRGYASFVLCRQCGYTARCLNCNVSMTYHSNDNRLICHYCGYTIRMPETCPKCKSKYIRHFGTGTQRVEEEVKKCFKDFSVIRMDMDTTSSKNSHEKILAEFRNEGIDVMVGTQMIAKGHDFPNVTLVGVLAADSLLNIEDFRASERTFQLITQVSGRAGRGKLPGRVVIQSYNIDDFSIKAACRHDYIRFFDQEILLREKLVYPPFTNIATVLLSGENDKSTSVKSMEIKKAMSEEFEKLNCKAEILGPSRAPLPRIKSKFRWRIVIKCKSEEGLINVLGLISDKFHRNRNSRMIQLNIDINPLNML